MLEGYRLYKHVDTVIRKHTIRPQAAIQQQRTLRDFHRITVWLDIHLLIRWLVVLKG
jgi:hypothetical protein